MKKQHIVIRKGQDKFEVWECNAPMSWNTFFTIFAFGLMMVAFYASAHLYK